MPKLKFKLFFISLFLFFSFIFFSYLVAKERFTQIDFDTTVKLQDRLPRHFDLPFSIFSLLGIVEITVLGWFVLLLLLSFKKYFLAALALFLFWLGLFVELFGKLFVHHPAPPQFMYRGILKLDLPSYYVHTDYSYPSGHVYRTAFLIAFLIAWGVIKLKGFSKYILCTVSTFYLGLMIVSRIYLGEHWFSDVLGGVLLGASFGCLAALFVPGNPKKVVE